MRKKFCRKSWLIGFVLRLCCEPVPFVFTKADPVPANALVSADGYVLMDKSGVYLSPKEVE